ncbi:MAG: 4'-phosphopantetheinyl transferase superfamily protein [Lachnospiraceae bacterium]|nr:4'-phosphopantetheinyl transferase superfamily protein [Lachnospiraceae bacterium]
METLLLFIADVRGFINKDRFNRYFNCMPEVVREKILELKNDKAKRQTLGGWSLLCGAMTDELNAINVEDFSKADVMYMEHGKPFLSGMSDLHFNISHSGDYAICAVSDTEVGCDIEKTGELNMNLAERFFTPEEKSIIRSSDDFFKIWVKKESVIKCTGEGMSRGLDTFSVLSNKVEIDGEAMYTGLAKAPNGYKIAVCNYIEHNKARFITKTFN